MSVFVPSTAAEACTLVREHRAQNRTLRIEGGGTRAGLGRPVQSDAILSTGALRGILIYEPAEMVLRARAGTPLAEIESALVANNQMLPFEPIDHRSMYGTAGEPTIGGLAACNISGPRRLRAGAARDSLIGVRFVNGAGEELSSGGRVMKNVTGLDLVKLQCGAHGTLGLITEVTFKLLPRPETTGTLAFDNLGEREALEVMALALQSPFEVSAAAHVANNGTGQTALRIEHFKPSVTYRLDQLARRLAAFGKPHILEDQQSQAFWRDVRDVMPLANPPGRVLWRVSIRSSAALKFVSALRMAGLPFDAMFDHGGGLVWLAVEDDNDGGANIIRSALPAGAGHAMLVRAPEAMRNQVPVFQPLGDALMKVSSGIKTSLDAGGIFNPGRMYAGI